MIWGVALPFLIALVAVAAFSFFAFLAERFYKFAWSRFFMWLGILALLAGVWFFGLTVYRLPLGWMIGAIAFFAAGFVVAAGYFIRRIRALRDKTSGP